MRKTLIVLLTVFAVAIGVLTLARPTGTPRAVADVSAEESQNSSTVSADDVSTTSTSTTVAPTTTTTAPAPPPTTAAPKPRSTTSTSAPAAAKKPAGAARTTSGSGGAEAFLECVAGHESGHDDTSHNSHGSGGYYGIMVATWHSYGQSGLPYAPYASHALQHQVALQIYTDVGPRAWSTRHFCGY